jgi:hypothetical protein
MPIVLSGKGQRRHGHFDTPLRRAVDPFDARLCDMAALTLTARTFVLKLR